LGGVEGGAGDIDGSQGGGDADLDGCGGRCGVGIHFLWKRIDMEMGERNAQQRSGNIKM